jgi:hypothetical protein
MNPYVTNKHQFNKNIDLIIESNNSLSELLSVISTKLPEDESDQNVIIEIGNGRKHLSNMNLLMKTLKR